VRTDRPLALTSVESTPAPRHSPDGGAVIWIMPRSRYCPCTAPWPCPCTADIPPLTRWWRRGLEHATILVLRLSHNVSCAQDGPRWHLQSGGGGRQKSKQHRKVSQTGASLRGCSRIPASPTP